MIFATPTKVVSEAGATAEYMGANKVPDLQKLFQVTQSSDWIRHQFDQEAATVHDLLASSVEAVKAD